MKTCIILIIILLGLGNASEAQNPSSAPHGGLLRLAGYYKVELVDCHEYVEAYLYELDLCPILNSGLSGQIDFHYINGDLITSRLYPYGVDAFTAEVKQHCYTGCTVSLQGVGAAIKVEFSGFSDSDEDCRPAKGQVPN